jgi:hypothetical protein
MTRDSTKFVEHVEVLHDITILSRKAISSLLFLKVNKTNYTFEQGQPQDGGNLHYLKTNYTFE